MLGAICAELGAERNGFGEEVVYKECQLSYLGAERAEFGQRPVSDVSPKAGGMARLPKDLLIHV